jgi:TRAP-type C4-dicarboxylate transport system substrate-binding protein
MVFLAVEGAHAQSIDLKLSHFMSPMHNLHVDVFVPFAKEVEAKSKGKAKVSIFPGEALGKAKDHYDMAAHGITDIAFAIPGYTPGRFPLSSVIELPFLVPSAKIGSRVIWEIQQKYLQAEYPGVKILSMWVHSPGHIHMTKKPAKTLEDVSGVRLRSPGPMQIQLLKELGVSPLTIPIPELYDALQKGMADGAVIPFSSIADFKLSELIRYHTMANMYVMAMGLFMNPKTWDSLPADVQKAILEAAGSRMSEMAGASYDNADLRGMDAAKKVNAEITTLSSEEKKRWIERSRPVTEKWIVDMDAKGLPGKKAYEETRQLLEKYSK